MLLQKAARFGALLRIGFFSGTLLAIVAFPTSAQTLTPFDSGSVTKTATYTNAGTLLLAEALSHDPENTIIYLENSYNCNTQNCMNSNTVRANSYAVFDVPATLNGIASVELRFNLQQFGVENQTGQPLVFEWQAWDVNTAPAEFQVAYSGSPTAPGLTLFADLGSGIQYAGGTSQGGGAVSVQLQGAALSDFSAAQGGVFGIGFTAPLRYLNLQGTATASFSEVQLIVTSIPEPGTATMMLLGLCASLLAVRRRRH